jgi:hypothetical protein
MQINLARLPHPEAEKYLDDLDSCYSVRAHTHIEQLGPLR